MNGILCEEAYLGRKLTEEETDASWQSYSDTMCKGGDPCFNYVFYKDENGRKSFVKSK